MTIWCGKSSAMKEGSFSPILKMLYILKRFVMNMAYDFCGKDTIFCVDRFWFDFASSLSAYFIGLCEV